jgi:hypothetical protein
MAGTQPKCSLEEALQEERLGGGKEERRRRKGGMGRRPPWASRTCVAGAVYLCGRYDDIAVSYSMTLGICIMAERNPKAQRNQAGHIRPGHSPLSLTG